MPENQKEKRQRLFLNAVNSLQLENPNAEIADKIGYNRGNMSRILNKQIPPSTTVVQKFEEAFGVSIKDFDFDEKKKTPPKEGGVDDLIAGKVYDRMEPLISKMTEEVIKNVGSLDMKVKLMSEYLEELHRLQKKTQHSIEVLEKKQ